MSGPSRAETGLGPILWSFRREFMAVGVFSGIANLLLLTPTIYMLQVYDRVLGSGSHDTLIALTLITGVALAALGLLETVRTTVLARLSTRLGARLSPMLLAAGAVLLMRKSGSSASSRIPTRNRSRAGLTRRSRNRWSISPSLPWRSGPKAIRKRSSPA